MSKNDIEDIKNDLHLAEYDYRHLNLPKHESVSIKEVISQLQNQSSPQQIAEEQASLFPFHLNLAQADVPGAVQAEQEQQAAEDASIEDSDEEPLAEDPGVMLLPDTIDEVVQSEASREGKIKLPVDDDGSQELYRIHHKNEGRVDDQPRDLGIPPVDYPLPKTYTTLVAPQQIQPAVEQECCSSVVEIKITTQLVYLGDYCCGNNNAFFNSNYAWSENSGCGCDCGPYKTPAPPEPNYTIVFHNCDGEQWLDITICNSVDYANVLKNAYSSDGCGCGNDYKSDYQFDDCCTTYRVDIPASFGLDCDCPIVELQTDQVHIDTIYDLLYSSNTHFIDCHGTCYELTTQYSGSTAFTTTELDIGPSSSSFVLERCECDEPVRISLVNQDCGGGTTSGSTYYNDGYNFNFEFVSADLDHDGDNESALVFSFNSSQGSGEYSETTIELPSDINCVCPIEEIIFDERDFKKYVQDVTNYGSTALTSQQVLDFFANNGFFEDCHDECYDLNYGLISQTNTGSSVSYVFGYELQACDDCTRIDLNVDYSCTLVDRFNNWVDNVAPCSFDPFQFFTNNVKFELVDCGGAEFVEVNFTSVDYSIGNGFYATYQDTLRISLPEGFCVDNFNEVVIDPKMIYEFYQDSCYQYGFDIGNAVYALLNNDGLHIVNTKTGAEYEVNYNSCTYSYEIAPASCEEAICINPVNPLCEESQLINIPANFNDGGCGCCGGECQTEYSYQGESYSVSFNFEFIHSEPNGDYSGATIINFNYSIDGSQTDTYVIDASGFGLSCLDPIVNFTFDECDFVNHLNDVSLLYGNIQGFDLIDYFAQNGTFEDCEGNCLEIEKIVDDPDAPSPTVSYILQGCTDCTETPINVSIDDSCNVPVDIMALNVNESQSDAEKMAYFQNLYTLEYVNCNGANFVEFTYYYNNSDENCQYSSFPACSETVRISITDCGCDGAESNEDASSPITQLVLDCNFIADFFDPHFVNGCTDISYNIAQSWGTDFLNYVIDSQSEFKTEDGTIYLLDKDDCGNYVIPENCEDCCIDVPVDITLNNPVAQPYVVVIPFFQPITFTYTSQVNGNVYDGHLIQTQPKEDGTDVSKVDNQFTFNFTYTHCDIDSDGTIDNFLTFQIDTNFTYSNNSNGVLLSNDPPVLEYLIAAPLNDSDCCSFSMMFDEKDFVDRLMTINRTLSIELSGQTIFDTLITIGDAIFTDCDGANFVISGSSGNYSLEAYDTGMPVVLDLTGNGIHLSDAANGVQYDMNSDGVKDQSAWIGEGNGLLVYDVDQNQTVSNASEFVLTDHVPGAKTDLEALRIGFDSNHDELFDQKDAAWNLFGIWQDANKDAVVDNGEYHTLAQLGIASIGLNVTPNSKTVESGNLIHGLGEFTWADGSKGVVADVALHYEDVVSNNSSVTDPAVSNPTVAEQSHVVAQNDPVVQSAIEQLAHQATVA